MRATDIVGGPFTPPGFYYKTFIRPRRLWPRVREGAAPRRRPRHAAEAQDDREWRTEYRRRHCDVLVIGGGIAGLQRRAARGRARRRRGARATRTSSPAARCCTRAGTSAPARSPTRARAAGVEILSPRARARVLRRARAGLAGRHAAPDPRRAPHRRDRHARAAARVPRQRPARRDAGRRRAPARRALRRQAGRDGRRRHDGRPRARRRARAARRRRARRRRRRPAPGRRRRRARRAASRRPGSSCCAARPSCARSAARR